MWYVGMRFSWRARSPTESLLWPLQSDRTAKWVTRMQLYEAARTNSNWDAMRVEREISTNMQELPEQLKRFAICNLAPMGVRE